jgi:hypothetical protein
MTDIHSSSPATVRTTSGSIVASPSFSPPAKSLLLIGIGDANNNSTTASLTDNLGTHLTYTRKVRSTGSGGQGQAELWIADVPATAPGPMVVTGTFTGSGGGCNTISILVLTSADPVALQAGATALGNWNKAGSTAIALTTLRDKSWVFAFTADWNLGTPSVHSGCEFYASGVGSFGRRCVDSSSGVHDGSQPNQGVHQTDVFELNTSAPTPLTFQALDPVFLWTWLHGAVFCHWAGATSQSYHQ